MITRRGFVVPALLAAGAFSSSLALSASALAQSASDYVSYNMPRSAIPAAGRQMVATTQEAGRLGGGFFEFLLTGHSASPNRTASGYSRPQSSAVTAYYDPQSAGPRRVIDPIYLRQSVDYDGREKPGTIVVDTSHKFLYLVEPGRRALRYGIGVGRQGFAWSGIETISRKAEWPDWTPPAEMLKRRPDLPLHMNGGPANPLGARALYLGSSLYRIHGTNEPETIGTNVSSGCIRMMNEDVIDLYNRVNVGTRVVVM